MQTNQQLVQQDIHYYVPTFKRYPLAIERGEGARIWDVEGNEYIDALAGIAVNNLGHCHSKVVSAICDQAKKLMHISNFFVSQPQAELSKKLVEVSGMSRVFFSNSGAESVEGAIKFARKYAHSKGRGGKIISMKNSFHGRTLATIATGKKAYQRGFGPMPDGFVSVPFNDMEAVKKHTDADTAAVILEPVQGEGGIHLANPVFLKDLRKFCDKHDMVLIMDEIQCGIGRTGKLFAKDHFDIEPDLITLAKGLGSGFPVGAILMNERIAATVDFGDHGTTFGGNPLACAAALATLEVMEDEEVLKQAVQKGIWLKEALLNLELPGLKEVRGLGLMIGAEFEFEAKPLVLEMLNQGVVANATAGKVLRLVPPLTITKTDLQKVVDTIKNAYQKVQTNA
jgi:acetylornithine/N-succinyldiaminopimelate aminotransferase